MDARSDPKPDPGLLPAPAPPSLFDRLGQLRRDRPRVSAPAARGDWIKAALLFAVLVAGPLASIAINRITIARAQDGAAEARARRTPAEIATARIRMGRAVLAAAFERPAPVVVLSRLAAVLPVDSRIARVGQRQGALYAEIATSDPDRLRAALRRDVLLGVLRETGQRQGDGVIVVALAQAR
ncbi:hypothetical protein [Sphingomonas japonica]|uniref:Uncharacterized protein n=1 Tax=Sphingomonas japonica TaxID=511662 RepID=A0ABX0TXU4_9SPHN|nr:hypothetical protein [Sphingomonas japonica]NIJ23115.1 hypothetical protein [Sphingomonas japonica]